MATAAHAPGLIDTNIFIDAARNVPQAVAFLKAQRTIAAAGLQASVITAMELIAGCRNAAELARLTRSLRQVTVWPLTPASSHSARQLMELFALGHGLTIPDALIAATAPEQSLPLYTLNVRHFQMIPSLILVRPY